MNLGALQALIAAGESQTMEFKTSFDKASVESLVAFANAQGGTVLVDLMATFAQKQPESPPESPPESQPESNLSLEAKVLQLLSKAPMGKRDISAVLGQTEVSGQLNKVIRMTVATGLIETTIPDKTNSRLQQYRLTVQR